MDYENEIIRLRRLNMKMYFTMSNIISILNKRETEELYKITMTSVDKDIINLKLLIEDNDELIKIKGRINNLEEEIDNLKKKTNNKCFVDTDEEHIYNDNTDSE